MSRKRPREGDLPKPEKKRHKPNGDGDKIDKDWISATEIRHIIMDNKTVAWLKLYGTQKGNYEYGYYIRRQGCKPD